MNPSRASLRNVALAIVAFRWLTDLGSLLSFGWGDVGVILQVVPGGLAILVGLSLVGLSLWAIAKDKPNSQSVGFLAAGMILLLLPSSGLGINTTLTFISAVTCLGLAGPVNNN